MVFSFPRASLRSEISYGYRILTVAQAAFTFMILRFPFVPGSSLSGEENGAFKDDPEHEGSVWLSSFLLSNIYTFAFMMASTSKRFQNNTSLIGSNGGSS